MPSQPYRCPLSAALHALRQGLLAERCPRAAPAAAVGASCAQGLALYYYPEIAGYWLAWAAQRQAAGVEPAAARLLPWLAARLDRQGLLPTRMAAATRPASRYRGRRFLFDHAMLHAGLAAWTRSRADARASALLARLDRAMAAFVEGASLCPLRPAAGSSPAGWSCGDGPFLLKVLARLPSDGHPCSLALATQRPRWMSELGAGGHRELHPQFYAIEGLLGLGEVEPAARVFAATLRLCAGPEGLGEMPRQGPRRSDVLAQALRLACALAAAEGATAVHRLRRDSAWRGLARELASRVAADGSLPFAADPAAPRPRWAALFAEQALGAWIDPQRAQEALV